MAATRVLTEEEAVAVAVVAEAIVPGSAVVGAVDYVDRVAGVMPAAELLGLRAAIAQLARAAGEEAGLATVASTPAFGWLRSLVIDAYYGDYAAPGYAGPTGWQAIGYAPPQAVRLAKDWSFLDERAPR